MTTPTEAQSLREAVARDDAREKRLADIVDRYVTDCTLVHRTLTEEDVWLLEGLASGPIGAHIAKIEADRDAAIAMQREPVGDTWDEIRRLEGECRSFQAKVNEWREIAHERRTERDTAEAQVATLTARIADLEQTYTDEAGNAWSPPTAWAYFAACRALHAKTARITEMEAALERADADFYEAATALASVGLSDALRNVFAAQVRLRAARSALSNKDAGHE